MNKIAKRCQFPNRAIRDAIFLGMNSQKTRDKAINFINEEGKVLTMDFLMNQLEIEDCKSHHKSLSQLDSTTSVNFVLHDHRQNKQGKNKKNAQNGKQQARNKSGEQGSSNSRHHSRKPPGMEGKCMRCGNQTTSQDNGVQLRMPSAGNVTKYDTSTRFAKARKEPPRGLTSQQSPRMMITTTLMKMESDNQNPPPRVNMLKVVNHIEANTGKFNERKHLKFPIASHPKGPFNHHIMVRVDTGADVNCMNENTFNKLFPEVQLSVCPHKIQNFGNSIADISILEQFCTNLKLRDEKYLNTFIVTDANDCPNLLSHGATFRMGVLLSNYPKDMVIEGENVPHFSKMSGDKMRAPNGLSNVFQILGDTQK